MALKFSSENMPITSKITRELELNGIGIIIIQHGVKDSIDFAYMLKENSGGNVLFLPKPFSKNKSDIQSGLDRGLKIENPGEDYKNGLERPGYLNNVLSNFGERAVLIIEVGGCFSNVINNTNKDHIKGLVEVTTFGHNRHLEQYH